MEDKSDYGRLERAIAMLGIDDEPPAGWEARVLAAVKPDRLGGGPSELGLDAVRPRRGS